MAAPGYYQVRLASGVNVELTATARTGYGRFSFPAGPVTGIIEAVEANLAQETSLTAAIAAGCEVAAREHSVTSFDLEVVTRVAEMVYAGRSAEAQMYLATIVVPVP